MHTATSAFLGTLVLATAAAHQTAWGGEGKEAALFVRVSPRDPRYFELSDGSPYIPIGLNMVHPGTGMDQMKGWLEKLGRNRGNFCRVWLSHRFYDVEHARSGEYDVEQAKRIDELLAESRKRGIRLKLCIEYFRSFFGKQTWSAKPLHHVSKGGPAQSIADFFDGERPREQFRRKLAWYARRYGDDPIIFGWELWNEVDCVRGGDWMAWTKVMLAELHHRFPRNLAMQSLGSFDSAGKRNRYRAMSLLEGNDVAQVHRYLDLGASLDVCRGPVDVLAADAVREILSYDPKRPVLLAESGAVEPRHTGPFKLYAKDKAGILLHDVLFAPFFAGAAGPGHIWHWGVYVDKMDLWHHFDRFAEAVKGIDPPAEGSQPIVLPHDRLRVMALKGRRTFLAWCRDSRNTWATELRDGQQPQPVRGATLNLGEHLPDVARATVRVYDPWANRWTSAEIKGKTLALPDFTRSVVLKIQVGGQ